MRLIAVSTLCLLAVLLVPATASAGQYSVASCQADQVMFSTRAFTDFATRGMSIRRACNPQGRGLRGLVTGNVVRRQPLRRGAVSLVAITAPAGTRFTTFRWAGTARRVDCRFALQLYADVPGGKAIPMKNVRANRRCPRKRRAQSAYYPVRTFSVAGASRIVQRVICVGNRTSRSCSARGINFIRTYKASVDVVDSIGPTASIIANTPLARGAWVSGYQPLNYTAADNVGVRSAQVFARGRSGGSHQRTCALAAPTIAYSAVVPCPSGPGQIAVNTRVWLEGTQRFFVAARDAAGNSRNSAAPVARVDNTAPSRVDTMVEGGDAWRNRNSYAVSWENPVEPDRAPIVSARYKLCAVGPGTCTTAAVGGLGLSRLAIQVPAQGEWSLSMWRRDAAGNESAAVASVPVTLRYDAEAPRLAFTQVPAADPTLISVAVSDNVSGLAGGVIELSRQGSGTWQTLPTTAAGDRLAARVDDAALPSGTYVVRARARDRAGNESSTREPLTLTLPIRVATTVHAGFAHRKLVWRTVRRDGKRRRVRRPVTVLRDSATIELGRRIALQGRLANAGGRGVAGATLTVLSQSLSQVESPIAEVHTDAQGRFTYTATGTMSRALRIAYGGSPLLLPARREVRLRVPAASSLRVDRRRVLNGEAVQIQRQGSLCADSADWQARGTAGSPLRSLADVPHAADRSGGPMVDPVPLPADRWSAAVPLPAAAAARSRVFLYSRRLAVHCYSGQGAMMRSPRNSRHRAGSSDPSTRAKGDRVLKQLRQRLTYANVMSTLAVFIALGGSSYAAFKISGSDIKNRSIAGKKLKRNTLTGKQIKESRLSRVPRARNADRVGGATAASLRIRCPSDTFPSADVCVERTPRSPTAYGSAVLDCALVGTPAAPGRRLPTHGELMAALTAVTLAPGGELTSEVSGSSATPGEVNVLYVTNQGGGVALTPNTAAGSKAFRCVTDPLN